MKRGNWAIFDASGFVYTGDTSKRSTGWSTSKDDAVLFATKDRATLHMKSNEGFDGCSVGEV